MPHTHLRANANANLNIHLRSKEVVGVGVASDPDQASYPHPPHTHTHDDGYDSDATIELDDFTPSSRFGAPLTRMQVPYQDDSSSSDEGEDFGDEDEDDSNNGRSNYFYANPDGADDDTSPSTWRVLDSDELFDDYEDSDDSEEDDEDEEQLTFTATSRALGLRAVVDDILSRHLFPLFPSPSYGGETQYQHQYDSILYDSGHLQQPQPQSHPHSSPSPVLIHRLPTEGPALSTLLRLNTDSDLRRDPWNPAPHVYGADERIYSTGEAYTFVQTPALKACNEPPLKCVLDCVDLVRQVLEGMVFIHEQRMTGMAWLEDEALVPQDPNPSASTTRIIMDTVQRPDSYDELHPRIPLPLLEDIDDPTTPIVPPQVLPEPKSEDNKEPLSERVRTLDRQTHPVRYYFSPAAFAGVKYVTHDHDNPGQPWGCGCNPSSDVDDNNDMESDDDDSPSSEPVTPTLTAGKFLGFIPRPSFKFGSGGGPGNCHELGQLMQVQKGKQREDLVNLDPTHLLVPSLPTPTSTLAPTVSEKRQRRSPSRPRNAEKSDCEYRKDLRSCAVFVSNIFRSVPKALEAFSPLVEAMRRGEMTAGQCMSLLDKCYNKMDGKLVHEMLPS